jgi:hypothetical protein
MGRGGTRQSTYGPLIWVSLPMECGGEHEVSARRSWDEYPPTSGHKAESLFRLQEARLRSDMPAGSVHGGHHYLKAEMPSRRSFWAPSSMEGSNGINNHVWGMTEEQAGPRGSRVRGTFNTDILVDGADGVCACRFQDARMGRLEVGRTLRQTST